MSTSVYTRRAALAALVLGAPTAALAARSQRIAVDVSSLRRSGDNIDADYFADVLPGYLQQSFGPGHSVIARITDVVYGSPGSSGARDTGAIDWIDGVGIIDGRSVALTCSAVATVLIPDIGNYGARQRQDTLARSFAQWLPRQAGL
jgi:hypothetical protein